MTDEFLERLAIMQSDRAEYFATTLFRESFGQPFPVPRDASGRSLRRPGDGWHQYVALWKNADDSVSTVGFCNWIRFDEVYLEGGMCVDRRFYRRLSRPQWEACRKAGGIAQLMMETAARELDDATAWFGHCGDRKAYLVDRRVGYVPTDHQHLIVKWFRDVSAAEAQRIIGKVAALGPF